MFDPKTVGARVVAKAESNGSHRETLDDADEAQQVRDFAAQKLDLDFFEVFRDGIDVVVQTRHVAPHEGPDPSADDSGYGPDSYYGRAMQKDD